MNIESNAGTIGIVLAIFANTLTFAFFIGRLWQMVLDDRRQIAELKANIITVQEGVTVVMKDVRDALHKHIEYHLVERPSSHS